MTIYFEESYDPSIDDVLSIDVFEEIAAQQNVHSNIFSGEALGQFNLNRNKLSERRDYLKAIKEYTDGK